MSATATDVTHQQFLSGETQWQTAPEKPILPGQTEYPRPPTRPILPGQTSWIDITVTPGHPDMSRGARIMRATKYFVVLVLHLALRFYAGYLAYECNAALGPATQWFFTILAFLFPIFYLIFYGVYHKLFGVQCPTGVSTTVGQPMDMSGLTSPEPAPILGGLRKFKLRRH